MKNQLILALSLLCITMGFSQTRSQKIITHSTLKSVEYEKSIPEDQFFSSEYPKLGLASPKEMTFKNKIRDKSGFVHTKYKQSFKGIPVVGGTYILHSKNGLVKRSSGKLYPYIHLETEPKRTIQEAETTAINFIIQRSTQKYSQFNTRKFNIKAKSSELCIIDKAFPNFSGNYHLAYKVEIKAFLNTPILEYIYVDATTNEILYNHSGIHQESVPATGNTLYYGEQSFMVDSLSANSYKLFDDTRGDGIVTIDGSQPQDINSEYGYPLFSSKTKHWDLSDTHRGNAALDAHYSATQYYDFLKNRFDRNSIDNEGFPLISVVHIQSPFFANAYWDGYTTNYGDGDCKNYGPLTSIEIVAHEFTHGLTNFTSELIYDEESGAINEAMSDIFGKSLELTIDPDHFSWIIGESILTDDDAEPIRNMKDPNLQDDPKYYKGEMWEDGADVHVNSGVFNYWFYLIVEGESGINEKGYNYDVKSIGLNKALDIVYGVQTGYLTESSNYIDLYQSTVAYAKELFGETSVELENVIEAWKTIGLDDNLSTSNLRIDFTDLGNNFFESYCEDQSELDVAYQITNDAVEPIPSGTIINIKYTIGANEVGQREIILSENLASGSSLDFIDTIDITNAFSFFTLHVSLLSDNTELNNSFYFSGSSSGKDLSISFYNLSDAQCTSIRDQYIIAQIYNQSCREVEAGETARLIFKNDKGEYTQDITFSTRILPNSSESIFLQLNEIPEDFGLFNIILEYDNDVNLDNNSLGDEIVGAIDQLNSATLFDFSDSSLDALLQKEGNFAIDAQIVKYKGNDVLGFQGVNQFISFGIDCDDATDFFISQIFPASINFCVSMDNFDQPAMKFDLTTIINETFPNYYSFPDSYYAIVKIILDNSEFPIIIDQENYKTINHDIELPKNYNGPIKISLFVIGADNESSSDIFKNNNWILFDNIEFYDKKGVANEDIESTSFNIYPNPAKEILSIISQDQNTSYEIKFFDILGQQIGQEQFIGELQYDVSHYNTGTIFYQIFKNGNPATVGKVAIIK